MPEQIQYPLLKYDEHHDVMHVYLSKRCNEYESSAEEEYPDVYVLKDDETDETVGFKILDYKKLDVLSNSLCRCWLHRIENSQSACPRCSEEQ